MLLRFSLYGFLKNQQYYEPFIILAFREKGLSFFQIGLLVGFRELWVNLMEVPSGVVADLSGRRRAMILSFSAYIVSFAVFASSSVLWHLFAAMFFFAVGEAFRTGTHKAMILGWLRLQGREAERTRTYGYTRSWSKVGSAVSALIAAALVFSSGRYSSIFLYSIIPYLFGIVNFLGYPAELDGRPADTPSLKNVLRHLGHAFRRAFGAPRLRRVLVEGMGYESLCKVAKDYLQPALRQMATGLPVLVALADRQRTALLVAVVYFVLYIASGAASRRAHRLVFRLGGESRTARSVWLVTFCLFVPMTLSLWYQVLWPAVAGFVLLELLRNIERPVTISRVDYETEAEMGATMLSIESQAKAAGAMVLAPLIGLGVDRFAAAPDRPALWVVGAVGLAITLIGALAPAMKPSPAELAARAADRSRRRLPDRNARI
jgi:MFS family permease